jgi:hypothetical protein
MRKMRKLLFYFSRMSAFAFDPFAFDPPRQLVQEAKKLSDLCLSGLVTTLGFMVLLVPPKSTHGSKSAGLFCLACQPGRPMWMWTGGVKIPVITIGYMTTMLLTKKKWIVSDIPAMTMIGMAELLLYRNMDCGNSDCHTVVDTRGTSLLAWLAIAAANVYALVYKAKSINKKKMFREHIQNQDAYAHVDVLQPTSEMYPNIQEHIPNAVPPNQAPEAGWNPARSEKSQLKTIIQDTQTAHLAASDYLRIAERWPELISFISNKRPNSMTTDISVHIAHQHLLEIQTELETEAFTANEHLKNWESMETQTRAIEEFLKTRSAESRKT